MDARLEPFDTKMQKSLNNLEEEYGACARQAAGRLLRDADTYPVGSKRQFSRAEDAADSAVGSIYGQGY